MKMVHLHDTQRKCRKVVVLAVAGSLGFRVLQAVRALNRCKLDNDSSSTNQRPPKKNCSYNDCFKGIGRGLPPNTYYKVNCIELGFMD